MLAHQDLVTPELASRFKLLSEHGNSTCSLAFQRSIAGMPSDARLQGSCCSPMDLERYAEQVTGLVKYGEIAVVPPDPYDIPAALAARLMTNDELTLGVVEQAAFVYATENSDERGPCCCQCWRWRVYGGLAKLLIREHGFSGEQVAELWDLSDGCGGAEDHDHTCAALWLRSVQYSCSQRCGRAHEAQVPPRPPMRPRPSTRKRNKDEQTR